MGTANWKVKHIPEDLRDRRVEITGPVDRKMVINALNSGAKTFMADFEDSNAPSWANNIEGQIKLKEETAVLLVRPRGLHLNERHLLVNEEEMSGSLVDFGLYVFHNSKTLMENG